MKSRRVWAHFQLFIVSVCTYYIRLNVRVTVGVPLDLTLLRLASAEMNLALVQGGLMVHHPCGHARK